MRIYVPKTVPLREAVKPCCHTVGMHGGTVILREEKTVIQILIFQFLFFTILLLFPCAQQCHCLSWECNPSDRRLCFGGILIDSDIGRIQNGIANMYPVVLKINGGPLKTKNFTAPCSGYQKQVCNRFPFQRFFFQSRANCCQFLRLKVVYILPFNLWSVGTGRDVEGDKALFYSLLHYCRDQAVILRDCLGGTGYGFR